MLCLLQHVNRCFVKLCTRCCSLGRPDHPAASTTLHLKAWPPGSEECISANRCLRLYTDVTTLLFINPLDMFWSKIDIFFILKMSVNMCCWVMCLFKSCISKKKREKVTSCLRQCWVNGSCTRVEHFNYRAMCDREKLLSWMAMTEIPFLFQGCLTDCLANWMFIF